MQQIKNLPHMYAAKLQLWCVFPLPLEATHHEWLIAFGAFIGIVETPPGNDPLERKTLLLKILTIKEPRHLHHLCI